MVHDVLSIKESLFQKAERHKNAFALVFAILVTLLTILFYQFNILGRLEYMSVDTRFALRRITRPASADIVFIDMAEDSIEAIGRWPWPRKWHATLVKALSDYNPRRIAFDVIFSEPQDETDDSAFEQAIKISKITYLPLLYNITKSDIKYLEDGNGIASVLKPIERFRKYSKGTGHINAIPDKDGIVRRVPPVIDYKGQRTYQLGFQIGCDSLGVSDENIIFYPDKNRIVLKKPDGSVTRIPLDGNNQLLINWKGGWGKAFKHYSYIDVIRSYALMREGFKPYIDLNIFRDKICIIGLTASGLIDIKAIPIEKAYPAVGVNAMTLNSVINSDFVWEAPKALNIFIIIAISFFMVFYLSRRAAIAGMGMAALSIILYAILTVYIFDKFDLLVTASYPIFAIFLSYVATTAYTQILESMERVMLFRQATRDGLTGLYNIRHFQLLFEAEFKNVATYKYRPLSVILADLDDFKSINDKYGHLAGDAILMEVAKVFQSKCRNIDVVARYGGEEFIVMLIGASVIDALHVAESIRQTTEEKKFRFRDEMYNATISVGVAEFSNEQRKEELIEKADKALYRAKGEGKNRVVSAG